MLPSDTAIKILDRLSELEKAISMADKYYIGHGYAPADYVKLSIFKPLFLSIRNYIAEKELPPAIEKEPIFNIYECKFADCKHAKCSCEDTPKKCGEGK